MPGKKRSDRPRATIGRYLPVLQWGRHYSGEYLGADLIAALIVSIMLIPQSLAYAMLAGLPPEMGLYASILPLVAYALFGTSSTLSVGPVAVVSLMTAAAAGQLAAQGDQQYVLIAILLAVISGLMLIVMGLLRLGFLANFLSHPVVSGFVMASGVIIAISQLKHILGVPAHGHVLPDIVSSLWAHREAINLPTVLIGSVAIAFLFWVRSGLKPLLQKIGFNDRIATVLARTGPVIAVLAGIALTASLNLQAAGVQIVGSIPTGLPPLALPVFDSALWIGLLGAAGLISIIGFVESISVAQTLAAKKRESIDPNQELIGLGVANLASGSSGGFPVTGGFARSAVNFDAGARTPAAGAFTAVGIGLATLFLTPYLFYLPIAVLAATIIVAVTGLIDLRAIRQVWQYSKTDFAALATTILVTLIVGIELGVTTGVVASMALHLHQTSRPHFAIVGQVAGTEHYRNIDRHDVIVSPHVMALRVDESLYFANARFLEEAVTQAVANKPNLKHLVLICSAVNQVDASGLESLETINFRLTQGGINCHLSDLKGPVADRLNRTDFFAHLSGNVYLSAHQAMLDLDPSAFKAIH